MNFIYPVRIHGKGSGLCNQILNLLSCCVRAKLYGINILILQKFLCDINDMNKLVPISDILDIDKMNKEFNKQGLYLFDASKLKLSVNSIKIDENEVLEKYIYHFIKDTQFEISKKFIFEDYKDKKYNIKIIINLNNYNFNFNSYLENGIINKEINIDINHDKNNYQDGEIWKEEYTKIFEEFLNYIYFQDYFYLHTHNWLEKNNLKNTEFNTLHLRIENDAIEHWCIQNNMNKKKYKRALVDKYKMMIDKYYDKKIPILLLTYDKNNEVVDYLNKNKYKILFREKNKEEGREINAIYDFLLGESTSGLYTGSLCSSFTQMIFFRNFRKFKDIVVFFLSDILKEEIPRNKK